MLPFNRRRSSTGLMSNFSYFASRTPSATFSKSQNTAILTFSWGPAIFTDQIVQCVLNPNWSNILPQRGVDSGRNRLRREDFYSLENVSYHRRRGSNRKPMGPM